MHRDVDHAGRDLHLRDGRDLGFKMVVASDCCASWTRELHDRSLRYLAISFGNVRTSDEIIADLAAHAATPATPLAA